MHNNCVAQGWAQPVWPATTIKRSFRVTVNLSVRRIRCKPVLNAVSKHMQLAEPFYQIIFRLSHWEGCFSHRLWLYRKWSPTETIHNLHKHHLFEGEEDWERNRKDSRRKLKGPKLDVKFWNYVISVSIFVVLLHSAMTLTHRARTWLYFDYHRIDFPMARVFGHFAKD